MTTIPEKRMNKNGVLVTKHVLANPPAKAATSLPAPSPVVKATGGAGVKIRPGQRKQKPFALPVDTDVDQLLIDDEALDEMMHGGSYFVFSASDEEAYAVLSATENVGDALHMLSLGVRTVDEAHGFLEEHEAEHLKADYSELTNELLSRNIDASHLVDHKKRLLESYPDTLFMADLIELNSTRALATQCRVAEPFIAEGEISLKDIKAVGVTDLKPYERLVATIPALSDINTNLKTKISTDDISWLIDRVSEELPGNNKEEYQSAIGALMHVGREEFEPVHDLLMLHNLSRSYKRRYTEPERKMVYATIVLQQTSKVPSEEMEKLFDSGIDPNYAGEMLLKGMTVDQLIDARDNNIASHLSDGWL